MNNWIAGAGGAVAVVIIAASAMVFADRSSDEEKTEAKSGSGPVATRTVCTDEKVVSKKEWGAKSVAGTLLGGAAGGVIGHQIGGGRGQDIATAAGAVGGAYAGNQIAKKNFPDEKVSYKQTCREVPVNS